MFALLKNLFASKTEQDLPAASDGSESNPLNLAPDASQKTLQTNAVETADGEVTPCEPDLAEAHCNRGRALAGEGRLEDAEASFREAIRLKPDLAKAHSNLGAILTFQGRFADAEPSFREAIRLAPDMAVAHSNLSNVLRELGRFTEAEASAREAIRLKPDYADAHNNLGNTLQSLGRFVEAEASCREAIRLNPDFAEAHNNLGNSLNNLGHQAEAEASFREAIRLKQSYAEAYSNLGNALENQGRLAEAEKFCREAIRLKPDFIFAHSNLANVLIAQGRLSEAETLYREAIRLKPDFLEAHSNLLFSLAYSETLNPSAYLAQAKSFGAMVSAKARHKFSAWHCAPNPKKLKIGFVSGDFRNHPVGYFIEGLFRNFDKSRFELVAYTTIPEEDALTQRIKPYFDHWVPLFGQSDSEAASTIHQAGLHILIDLAGHTAGNRLTVFSYKPAPVQVSWLGYWASTGVPEIDYLIADPWTLPENEAQYFSEAIWRLPETRLCFDPPKPSPEPAPSPALANGHVTFGCFSNLTKLNDSVVTLWAKVLLSVPNSRLLIKATQLADPLVRQGIITRFTAHGVDAERLTLEGPAPRMEYLDAYGKVDIVLDTFPFPGGTTTAEALWMGVPVLTLAGERFITRQGIGILMNADLSAWVTTDANDYVDRAIYHASAPQLLNDLRTEMRSRVQRSPIFDAPRFVEYFEKALSEMWITWLQKNSFMGKQP